MLEPHQDLGQYRNHFGLLTQDQQALDVRAFRDFLGPSATPTTIAQDLGIPRSSFYSKTIKLNRKYVKEKILPIIVVADLAHELIKDDERTRLWMLAPNTYFFNNSPLEICLMGEGDKLISFLLRKLGRQNEETKAS